MMTVDKRKQQIKMIISLYDKYREGILYLFFGGLTFFLAIGVYALFDTVLGVNELIANILSWVAGVTFAFFTNRIWVFRVKTGFGRAFFVQMGSFYMARVFTLLLQEMLLYLCISLLHYNSLLVKICTEIINIILNYVMSKLIIFRKK